MDSDTEYGRSCQTLRRSPPVTRIKNGKLYVHKDYEGRLPLCYYATGLQEGGPHDGYTCFNMRDILWARQVRFRIEPNRELINKMQALFARVLPSEMAGCVRL